MKVNGLLVKFHHIYPHYYQDGKYYLGMTECAIKADEKVIARGFSLCSKDEPNFNKKVGRFLALFHATAELDQQMRREIWKQYKKEHRLPDQQWFRDFRTPKLQVDEWGIVD